MKRQAGGRCFAAFVHRLFLKAFPTDRAIRKAGCHSPCPCRGAGTKPSETTAPNMADNQRGWWKRKKRDAKKTFSGVRLSEPAHEHGKQQQEDHMQKVYMYTYI
jgi:hypothetical protein